jgi:hypothetical protein
VFAAGFVVSAYVTGPAAERIARDLAQLSGLRHWGGVGLWIFGTGLFFFGMRALQINPLSFGAPIWLLLCTTAAIIFTIRCASWWRTTYPALLLPQPNSSTANSQQPIADS